MEIWLPAAMRPPRTSRPSGPRRGSAQLTEDGLGRRPRDVARGLAALESGIELVLTSPFARARQTAEPAARALKLSNRLRETSALEPDRDPEEILGEVREEKVESVLLVGHEPHLGSSSAGSSSAGREAPRSP